MYYAIGTQETSGLRPNRQGTLQTNYTFDSVLHLHVATWNRKNFVSYMTIKFDNLILKQFNVIIFGTTYTYPGYIVLFVYSIIVALYEYL